MIVNGVESVIVTNIVTVVCTGVIGIFLKSLSNRVGNIEKKFSEMPKEYILKNDCTATMSKLESGVSAAHDRVKERLSNDFKLLHSSIENNARHISKVQETLAYEKGLMNRKKTNGGS